MMKMAKYFWKTRSYLLRN